MTSSVILPARAQNLQARVETALTTASPGTRFGILVTGEDGSDIVAINAEGRFIPASNTKIVTTAAAFAAIAAINQPDIDGGTRIRLEPNGRGRVNIVIEGRGDARLSSAPDCVVNCLATLADAVRAKTRKVHDVIGDDTRFPDQRWSPGMSWNNIATRSGTAASALTLDDNEIMMTVTPGVAGTRPSVDLSYYQVDNQAMTSASGGPSTLTYNRAPNGMTVRLTGTVAAGGAPTRLGMSVDDPAHHAAWQLHAMLVARGVKATGAILARHRPADLAPAAALPATPFAMLTPPPLSQDLTIINKVSQNLHAELLLRRLGTLAGSGSIDDGLVIVRAMFARAGIAARHYALSDGSGMSTYNRLSPRGMVLLLRWAALQPWGEQWRATLPVGGEGMLARRFSGTPLAGRVFAKTGSLNATAALSGYMIAKSGRALTFSAFANDIPEGDEPMPAIDRALIAIAEAN